MIDAWEFLRSLDLTSIVLLFWFAILFEVPRFLIGALAVVVFAAGSLRRRASSRQSLARPNVSVVVPCYNGANEVGRTIESLREQSYPVQIIAVDDGSTDGTYHVLKDLHRKGMIDKFLPLSSRGGKSAAVNAALEQVETELVLIVDGDTSFDRNAIEEIIKPFDDPRVGLVSGNLGLRNPNKNLVTIFQATEYLIGISLGRRIMALLDVLPIASGAFGAFRVAALAAVGAQDMEVGEDADLATKLRRAGWRIAFAHKAWALTDGPETVTGFIRQRLRWERGVVTIWLRKFAVNLNPFDGAFSLRNALTTIDVLLFQPVLSLLFIAYLIWLFWIAGAFAWIILGATLFGYLAATVAMFIAAAMLTQREGSWNWLAYIPFYMAFNLVLQRPLRLIAYIDELAFRRSYRDPYVPSHVMNQVEMV